MDKFLLAHIGISEKDFRVYRYLVAHGTASVRRISAETGILRGSTYESLKNLQKYQLVHLVGEEKKQRFLAEHPDRLQRLFGAHIDRLRGAEQALQQTTMELSALYRPHGESPVARYVEESELRGILEDILRTCKTGSGGGYRIYSAEGVRKYLYESFPTFSDERIARGISVRVIAIGEGGELRGLDERRWWRAAPVHPTYIILYEGKTASISLKSDGRPMGVVVENDGIYETQTMIFDRLWEVLG